MKKSRFSQENIDSEAYDSEEDMEFKSLLDVIRKEAPTYKEYSSDIAILKETAKYIVYLKQKHNKSSKILRIRRDAVEKIKYLDSVRRQL